MGREPKHEGSDAGRQYDKVVIGSSPIAILHAIHYADADLRVCLVDKSPTLGGAWAVHEWGGIGYTEQACHLIEYYEGAYELLERVGGHRFARLDPQPIKRWKSGRVLAYASNQWFLRQFVSVCVKTILRAGLQAGRVALGRRGNGSGGQVVRANVEFVRFLYEHRMRSLLKPKEVRGPVGGWLAFLQSLVDRLEHVEVLRGCVEECRERKDGTWSVRLSDGVEIVASHLLVTESLDCDVRGPCGERHGCNKIPRSGPSTFYHVLTSVPDQTVVARIPYVHFPDNELFKRITPAHPNGFGLKSYDRHTERFLTQEIPGRVPILVQLRRAPDQIADLERRLAAILTESGIVSESEDVVLHDCFSESRHTKRSAKLMPGEYRRLSVLKSIGDLGISIMTNERLLR